MTMEKTQAQKARAVALHMPPEQFWRLTGIVL